jgi:hypothetical protein
MAWRVRRAKSPDEPSPPDPDEEAWRLWRARSVDPATLPSLDPDDVDPEE